MWSRGLLVTLGLLLALGAPLEALAACTLSSEARLIGKSARQRARCNDKVLRYGPGVSCPVPVAPPACAGTMVDDAIALAYGPNNPATSGVDRRLLRAQLACQRQIGRGTARFIANKLRLLITGKSRVDAEARARRSLDRVIKRCALTVVEDASTVDVPAVGAVCQPWVGAPGSVVSPEPLRDCLVTLLELEVDQIAPVPPPVRPNLIIILSDDQRADTLDATHESPDRPGPVMPILTSDLIGQGVHFPNAFATTALCCPSRSSILKGQYAHTTGVRTNTLPLGGATLFNDASTLATWLGAAGYFTGLYGKYLNGYSNLWTPPAQPYVPPGWDEWHAFEGPDYYDYDLIENGLGFDHATVNYPSGCDTSMYAGCPADEVGEPACPRNNYSTDVLLAKALTFIDQAAGQPFFLYLAPYAPHGPSCPAARHETLFQNVPVWRPPNYDEAGDESDKPAWVQNICPMGTNKKNNIDALREYMLGSLQAVDEAVGAIVDKLEDLGVDQNTLILYSADNGFSWGSHCHRPKSCAYEECMRVPLVVRYPVLAPVARVDERFGLNIDFAFTFAELAGIVPPIRTDGRSLVRLVADTERVQTWRDDFLYEHWDNDEDPDSGIPTLAAVRNDDWKWVEYVTGETELYNLHTDPFELESQHNNPAHAAVRAELAARLRELRPDWNP